MAKPIYNDSGDIIRYEPGIIYHLVKIQSDGTRLPFYVGETTNKERRSKEHTQAGKNATDESTLVYRTIKAFNEAGIEWAMETLIEYGKEGPTDLEDEWIMKYLYDGIKLTNEKKGNAIWMTEREAVAGDMKKRGISSYKKYRQVLTQEEADRKHAEWLEQERVKEELSNARIRVEQLKAEQAKRILEEAARAQAEVIRQKEIARKRKEEAKAAADAKWEAERPAREARIRADNKRLEKEEVERQLRIERQKMIQEEHRQEELRKAAEVMQRADKNYVNWPDNRDRYQLQITEDAMIDEMLAWGRSEEQIVMHVERERNMLWYPGRTQ